MKFSIYSKPVTNLYPKDKIELQDFIELLKGDKYKEVCEKIRELKKDGKSDEILNLKKNELDYITIAGNFKKREKVSLNGLSGYYVADIDNIENIEETREALIKDKYTHLLFTSPSGGLKVVIKLPMSLDNFEEYVSTYYDYLNKEFNIIGKLDKKTKDVSRACFCSYDPNCFFNENAERWDKIKETKTEVKDVDIESDEEESYPKYTEATLKAMLKHIPCRNWGEHTFYVMMGLIHYGKFRDKDYFGLFRWWIKNFDGSISVEDMQDKWNEYSNKKTDKPVTIRTIIHEAVDHGYKKPEKKKAGFDPLSNVITYYEEQPFFYDKSKIFWLWNTELCKYEIVDEVDIMNNIEEALGLYGQTIGSKLKGEYLEAFKRVGRKHIPKETPVKWIQFKDKAYSINSDKIYDVTPDYFFTNPIPWEIGDSEDTPVMDKLFEEWVGEEYVQDLYEIIAYCCYRDYPIQTMICLYGCGRNGKSQYLKIINKFLGLTNICSTELDMLVGTNSSRFEIFKLYKKLACMMGETNFGILSSTSILKKLVGGDVIGFEKKGKDPFDDYNYAKIIIASNSLPSTDDSSDGFMRRWHIIDFPNEFPEGKDIIATIPEKEYNNLAFKIGNIISNLIDKSAFNKQGTIEDRKEKYMLASNPLPIFIKKYCRIHDDAFISYNKLYTLYVKYLMKNKKRKVKMKEFKSSLESDGFWVEKTAFKINGEFKNGYYVIGLELFDNFDNFDHTSTLNLHRGSEYLCSQKSQNCQKKQEIIEEFIDTGIVKGSFVEFKGILDKNLDKNPQDVEELKNHDNFRHFNGNFDEYLGKAKSEGLIFEPKPGFVQRL